MPATIGGIIKAALSTDLPAVPVTRDEPSTKTPSTTFPYITINEGISRVPDSGQAPTERRVRELVQIDIWQKRDPATEANSYAISVIQSLENLNRSALSGNGGTVYRFKLQNSIRTFNRETRIVRETLTVNVTRHF